MMADSINIRVIENNKVDVENKKYEKDNNNKEGKS